MSRVWLTVFAFGAASAWAQVERLGFVATLSPDAPGPGAPTAISADGRFFAAVMPEGVAVWDLSHAVRIEGVPKLEETITALAFTPEDHLACAGSSAVWILDLRARAVRRLQGSWQDPSAMAFSQDLVAWADKQSNSVQIRALEDGSVRRSFRGETSEIRGLAFSPDGLRVAAGEAFRIARLWSVRTNCVQQNFPNRSSDLSSLNFSADGRWLLATSESGIQVSDAVSGEEVKRFLPDSGGFLSSAFVSDGTVIAISSDNGLHVWRSGRLSINAAARRPVLHVVVIGINVYQNPKWQLGYAEQDANDLDSFLEQHASSLFWQPRSVRVLGACATKDEIRSVFDQLAVDAQPDDAVLVFFSGHGKQSGNEFYIFPYDMREVEAQEIPHWALSANEIGTALRKIPARRETLIIDACQSGAAVSVIRGAFQKSQAAGRSLSILAASADTEEAMEAKEEGHGILTSALLARLRTAVKSGESESVSAWLEGAKREAPAMAAKYNKSGSQTPAISLGVDIPLLMRVGGPSARASIAETHPAGRTRTMPDTFTCRPTASDPTYMRVEGIEEPVGDIVFRCSGEKPVAIKVQLFANANFTQRVSQQTDVRSDAIAILEEPGTRTESNAIRLGVNAVPGRLTAANALAWPSLALPANTGAGRTDIQVRITNLRLNDTQLDVATSGSTSVRGVGYYTVENETGVVLKHQQTIAYITGILRHAFGACAGPSGTVSFNAALDENAGLLSGASRKGIMQLGVRVQESVPDQFLPAGTRAAQRQAPRGFRPFAESPEQGTRFILRLHNVPVGATVYASTTALRSFSSAQARAQLIETDWTGNGLFKPASLNAVGECGQSTVSMARLPVQGSTATAVWEVTDSDPFDLDTFQFGLMIAYRADPEKNLPSVGLVLAQIGYAPLSTINLATSSAVPRFADRSTSAKFFQIHPPTAVAVFPAVSQRPGIDSRIVILNTGQGPGSCTLSFRGSITGGGRLPAALATQDTDVLLPGQSLEFTLFGGGDGVRPTPGFEGCIVAVCRTTSVQGIYSTFPLGTHPVNSEKARILDSAGSVEAISAEFCQKGH